MNDPQKRAWVVALLERPELDPLDYPQKYRRNQVLSYLKKKSEYSWARVRQFLESQNAFTDKEVSHVRVLWLTNSVLMKVSPEGLKMLARAYGVRKIYSNRRIKGSIFKKTESSSVPKPTDKSWRYNYKKIGLERLKKEDPYLAGRGVVIGMVDTGVDGRHPALKGRVLRFFNGNTRKTGDKAYDLGSHGTHVAGIMVGRPSKKRDFRGIAPSARLVVAGAIQDYHSMLAGMEFMLDPDKDPATDDYPRVVNNSWNADGAPDMELFYQALAAWEALGITPVFSAGNNGPDPKTITTPKEYPGTIVVGNVGPNGRVVSRSSRGPADYHGEEVKKPDLVAPGEKIYSSVLKEENSSGFEYYSGSSMAAPHVTATIALMLEVNPDLNPDQIHEILISSANSISDSGWDPDYGYGRLNLYRAVSWARKVSEEVSVGRWNSFMPEIKSPEDSRISSIATTRPEIFDLDTQKEINDSPSNWLISSDIWP